jgi:hypothetical protein
MEMVMKVVDLIEELKKSPQDADVLLCRQRVGEDILTTTLENIEVNNNTIELRMDADKEMPAEFSSRPVVIIIGTDLYISSLSKI